MNNLDHGKVFFHVISKEIINFVSDKNKDISIAKHKADTDFSTQVDIGVEQLIIKAINKQFPQDAILSEESHTDKDIPNGRVWIIYPICGTNNLTRDINNFCTNIALAEDHQLIAACVIDHSKSSFIWSIGDNTIYENDNLYKRNKSTIDMYIDIDISANLRVDKIIKEKQSKFISRMILETNYYLVSLNSSLSFAYTALGKVDGFVNVRSNPWDIAAASFLIQQTGGIITDLEGNLWTLSSIGTIAAQNKEIHQKLLKIYNS